ncbi:MAG: hypothetical protein M1821_007375 [Bathelium mastoideum]|nr:MAG: hypothetical protein M1821_007375 [Bathelium mastoideum]
MASFSEYQNSIAVSEGNNDFVLYSTHDSYPDYMPTSLPYTSNPYVSSTGAGFEPFSVPSFPTTTAQSHDFGFGATSAPQNVKGHYPHTPAESPTNSANNSFDNQPPHLSSTSDSGASVQSTSSSAMGSPSLNPAFAHESWNTLGQGLGIAPGIVHHDQFGTSGFDYDPVLHDKIPGCVDPSLIQPYPPSSFPMPYPEYSSVSPQIRFDPHPPSPAPSDTSLRSPQRQGSNRFKAQSPFLHHTSAYQPYPQQYPMTRRPSAASVQSRGSHGTHRSDSIEEEGKEKGLCPIPECGRVFKDLKAHMLTHQNERPEKCPIPTCEYHQKGFARKYDKNRHTLTHYKGTMVCGFCPGPGSAAEKSFNRADVFKRHLTSVHGVEQTPPNSRKKSPAVSKKSYNSSHNTAGTCSTCSVTFANAQEFYEHLDDCVLRVVQQVDPSEATNQRLLASVADDKNVKETIDRLLPSSAIDYNANTYDEAEDDEEDESEKEDATDDTYGARNRSGKGGIRSNKKGVTKSTGGGSSAGGPGAHRRRGPGLTFSKGGVAANVSAAWSGRKKRKHYPPSWGCAVENMRMKKRVLCVYDGSRRLLKDDLMLNGEFEVRVSLPETGGRHYVTDLDIQTMARAEAMHNATAEEKGPWVADNVPGVDLEQLMA